MIPCKRLPVSGLYNIRDLGGYPTEQGATKYGAFVRSELPEHVTPEGLEFLRRYGVRVALDLRESGEKAEKRDPLLDCGWCRYCSKPAANPGAFFHDADARRGQLKDFSWSRLYIGMLENHKSWAKECLELLADAEGCVLFHCSAGKDRTAILAALLLGIAGVADCDIVADYTLSMVYMPHMYPDLPYRGGPGAGGERRITGGVLPDNMRTLLDHIRGSYGGFGQYAAACGIRAETLTKLREKLTGPI